MAPNSNHLSFIFLISQENTHIAFVLICYNFLVHELNEILTLHTFNDFSDFEWYSFDQRGMLFGAKILSRYRNKGGFLAFFHFNAREIKLLGTGHGQVYNRIS